MKFLSASTAFALGAAITAGMFAAPTPGHANTLRGYAAAGYTPIGVAAQSSLINANADNGAYKDNLNNEFNYLGAENDLKMYIWSGWNGDPMTGTPKIDWSGPDAVADFARQHGQRMRGHCLVYHDVVPGWLNPNHDNSYSPYTDAQIQHMVQVYIATVMQHYADVVDNWDVTNELFNGGDNTIHNKWTHWKSDGASEELNDFWFQHLGNYNPTTYFNNIYGWARAAVPSAKLYYCDFGTEYPGTKFNSMMSMLTTLKGNGCPIDGIAFQCHENTDNPSQSLSTANTNSVNNAGFQWQVTEFDCWTPVNTPNWDMQNNMFSNVANICTKDRNCRGLMIWGNSDKYSWLNVKTGLMFDNWYNRKTGYWAVDYMYANAPILGPAGYSFICNEWAVPNFKTPVDAALGNGNSVKYKYAQSGNVNYTYTNFGDALPGQAKYGYFKAFTWAASEYNTRHFDVPVEAAFGANGSYLYKWNASGDVSFVQGSFVGPDPAPGYVKFGYYMPYNWCAGENGSYNFSDPVDVAYGANGHYLFRHNVTGNVTFSNATWSSIGPDPAPGIGKSGYFRPSH